MEVRSSVTRRQELIYYGLPLASIISCEPNCSKHPPGVLVETFWSKRCDSIATQYTTMMYAPLQSQTICYPEIFSCLKSISDAVSSSLLPFTPKREALSSSQWCRYYGSSRNLFTSSTYSIVGMGIYEWIYHLSIPYQATKTHPFEFY